MLTRKRFIQLYLTTAAAVCIALLTDAAPAQPPSPDQIAADLAGPFLTSQAVPLHKEHGPLAKRIEKLMGKQAAYLISTLKPWPETSGALSLTDSRSGEHGVRPNAHTAYGLSVMYRNVRGGYPAGLTPEICRDQAISILRFVLSTHGAGGVNCSDGKPWKNQWQSALWADRAGEACWLMWDDLDPTMRWLAARMIADEADRFVDIKPPSKVEIDTKAEENAWNSTVISLAANMFPNHPHAADWRRTASIWAASSFVRQKDLDENVVVDGRALKDVVSGPTIHEDYTLENHHRVHPDYMNCINSCRYKKRIYTWGGQPVPEALDYNTAPIYSILKRLSFPDGSYVYPNGQDWQIHRNPQWTDTHAAQAVWHQDPEAACLLRICLETAEKMAARDPKGGMFLPDEFFFPSTQHFVLDMLGDVYQLFRGWGEGPEPISSEQFYSAHTGLHQFEAGKIALLRTPKSVSTFSWGQQVMGMVLPMSQNIMLNPNERSLIGMISVEGEKKGEAPEVTRVKVTPLGKGFGVVGELKRAGGKIKQQFVFAALEDGRTVYVDRVTVPAGTPHTTLNLGTLGLLNEPDWVYHNGKRTIISEDGSLEIAGAGDEETSPVVTHHKWLNIDDSLGIVMLGDSKPRQIYHPNHKPAKGRLEQLFHLNSVELPTLEKPATAPYVINTALAFYPGQNAEKTRECAAKATQENVYLTQGMVRLEDGTVLVYTFDELMVDLRK